MTKMIFFILSLVILSSFNSYLIADTEINRSQNKGTQASLDPETKEINIDQQNQNSKSSKSSSELTSSTSNSSSDINNPENPTKIDIKVTNIIAKINPQTEITLPAGSFSEHFKHNFNNLSIIFNFNYNFLANNLSGKISFEYPIGVILPYISFSDAVDFESYIQPSIINNKIQLAPTSKFLTRNRTLETGLKYRITRNLKTFSSFYLDDIFRGNLSSATVIESGLDLTGKVGTEFNSMRLVSPEKKFLFKGIYHKTSFNLKFRNKFNQPISLDHNENLLTTSEIGENWSLDLNANTGFPIKIWDNSLASFYTLGGFESIRGYKEKSINAFRYLTTSATIHRRITLKKEIKKRILKNYYLSTRIFDLYIFFDQCFAQKQLSINSPIDYFPSIGLGGSFIISGTKTRHLKISLFISQPIKSGYKPIVYLKSSFFQFEK